MLSASSYPLVSLSSLITDLKNGVEIRTYSESGYRYLRVSDLGKHGIENDNPRYVDVEEIPDRVRLTSNSFLISRSGSLGLVSVIEDEIRNTILGSDIFKVELDTTSVHPRYLEAFFRCQIGQTLIFQLNSGSIIPRLDQPAVKSLRVVLPPSNIQNHIVSFMRSAYDQKKRKEQEAEAILGSVDDYVLKELGIEMPAVEEKKCFVIYAGQTVGRRVDSSYYQSKFRSVDQIVENVQFDVFKLGTLINEISSEATPKVDENYYTDSSAGVPFLRVQNVTGHGIDLSDAKFITLEVHNGMLKRSQLKKDDLVFTITGRIGSVAVVPDNFEGNINQHSVRFHLKERITNTIINPNYVAAFLNSELGKSLAIREVTGGTRPALDYKALKSLKIILPSIEIQDKIVTEIKNRLAKVAELRQEADTIVEQAKGRVERILLAEE